MESNFIKRLAKKYVKGTASKKEKDLLEAYYAQKQISGTGPDDIDPSLQAKIFDKINNKIDEPRSTGFNYWYRVAAVLFVILGLGIFLLQNDKKPLQTDKWIVVTAKKGERKKLILPDSTIVWINADSKLSYSEQFSGRKRLVNLNGEAFFEVHHNAAQPFIVHSTKMDIKVLGTVFNVKAYPNEQSETLLISGSIQVKLPGSDKAIAILKPNQKFIIGDDIHKKSIENQTINQGKDFIVTQTSPKKTTQVVPEIEWKNNRLSFENEDFAEVAKRIERWYNVKVTISNPALLNYRFTGTFNNVGLTDVLESLKISQDFTYRKEDSTINIY